VSQRPVRFMALKDGDVIAFDYDLFVDDKKEVFDTTQKTTAEAAGLLDPNAFYAPMHYMLGTGRLIKGLEEKLRTLELERTQEIVLPAEDAYGPRDPKLIETLPIQEFKKNKVAPEVGLVITYKQRRGVVTYVGGGRIRVDFNHALAGKKLRYVVTLRKVAKTAEEKVRMVIQMDFPTALAWDVKVEKDVATIEVPEPLRFEEQFLVAKYRIIGDLRKVDGLNTVRVVESFPLMKEGVKETPATQSPAPPA
jgi:FKBP-type peptidyl-prolyl cis-trans isomerase 2